MFVVLFASFAAGEDSVAAAAVGSVSNASSEGMSAYDCVRFLGHNPDDVVYAYQNGRGGSRGRGTVSLRVAETAARRKGVGVIRVNVGLLSDRVIRILQCFYGKYSVEYKEFKKNPRLLCPRTGFVQDVYSGRPVMTQARVFMDRCR